MTRPDTLAAEAEPAINRADVDELEQNAVGIAMHDPFHRRMRIVADRIGAFLRTHNKLPRIGHKLPRNRIGTVIRMDELDHVRGQRHCIARRDLLERREPLGWRERRRDQRGRCPQRLSRRRALAPPCYSLHKRGLVGSTAIVQSGARLIDGDAYRLRLRAGPPLGVVETADYVDSTFLLPTGCNLLLYTDGLVEDHRYSLDRGLAELCAAVRSAPTGDPQALVEYILGAGVGPNPRRDDVAILALTVDAQLPPGPLTAWRRFRGDAASAAAARRFAGDILAAWGQDLLREDACLLLDEVITNAVQHTVGDVAVRMALGQRLRIEVHDRSNRYPDMRPVDGDSEMGRGLHIVERLSHAWGFDPLPAAGKVVWFELNLAR